ncbi:MAG: hypothetical protein ABJN62_07940 [Halioglobus sp.]
MSIPLEHSAIRFVTLVNWILLAVVSALLVTKLTASRLWGLSALVLSFGYVDSIVNEPGHPQAMVAIGTILIPLLATYSSRMSVKTTWLLLGFTGGVVLHLKLNAGAFVIAAMSVVLLCSHSFVAWRGVMRTLVVIGTLCFPFVLMWPLLSDPNCLAFAALMGVSAAAVSLNIEPKVDPFSQSRTALLAFSLGILAASMLAISYSALRGASPLDIIGSLLGYREGQIQFYHFFRSYSALQLALACVSAAVACVILWTGKHRNIIWLLWVARVVFIVMACYALAVDSPAYAHTMLGLAGPWVWVILVRKREDGSALARMMLAAVAVWSPLLAFPIPGSQLYFGSLAILLVALVNFADVAQMLCEKYTKYTYSQWLRALPAVVLFGGLSLLLIEGLSVRSQYRDYAPLALPGTEYMRMEPQRARVFGQLVEAIDGSDVVLTTFRFNSLYFWGDARAPVPTYLSHAPLAFTGEEQQAQLRQALDSAEFPKIVTRLPLDSLRPESELIAWIDHNFEAYRKIGGYTILRKLSVDSPIE